VLAEIVRSGSARPELPRHDVEPVLGSWRSSRPRLTGGSTSLAGACGPPGFFTSGSTTTRRCHGGRLSG
jgi:hypothetical protein